MPTVFLLSRLMVPVGKWRADRRRMQAIPRETSLKRFQLLPHLRRLAHRLTESKDVSSRERRGLDVFVIVGMR